MDEGFYNASFLEQVVASETLAVESGLVIS